MAYNPIPPLTESDKLRFWAKVAKPDENGCRLWTASTRTKGNGHEHGSFKLGRTMVLAHRIAWTIAHGDPGKMCVLHRCDVPRCCNVDHLWLGTHADNMADRDAKGRTNPSRGESNGRAKLTETEVLEIRTIYALGNLSQTQIAYMFCVSQVHISDIVNRKIWAHIPATTT